MFWCQGVRGWCWLWVPSSVHMCFAQELLNLSSSGIHSWGGEKKEVRSFLPSFLFSSLSFPPVSSPVHYSSSTLTSSSALHWTCPTPCAVGWAVRGSEGALNCLSLGREKAGTTIWEQSQHLGWKIKSMKQREPESKRCNGSKAGFQIEMCLLGIVHWLGELLFPFL